MLSALYAVARPSVRLSVRLPDGGIIEQESRAAARKPRDAASVFFLLKFANNIHYKYKTSQASKAATLQSSKHADA